MILLPEHSLRWATRIEAQPFFAFAAALQLLLPCSGRVLEATRG